MEIKKILCSVDVSYSPHQYLFGHSGDNSDLDLRINLFIGDRYFTFYTGVLSKKRALKRSTWLYELLYHRDERLNRDDGGDRMIRPIKILEGVEKTNRYNYKNQYLSAYLIRKLILDSSRPDLLWDLGLKPL